MSGNYTDSNRRARLPARWHHIRKAILRRDAYTCYVCGSTAANEVDHKHPGDDHSPTNLAAICTSCHRAKSSREGNALRWAHKRREAAEQHPGGCPPPGA
jgi:5-methylcytosine-specific restriction enzyme A